MHREIKVISLILMVGFSYGHDDCAEVSEGLKPIFAPCMRSATECATVADLDTFSSLLCVPMAKMQFENFERCTGTFSAQIFSALCGGSNCTGVGGTCDHRCFETVDSNNASEVFNEYMCGSKASTGLPGCPSSTCKGALQELVSDVGCCVNSVIYTLYLNICSGSANSSLLDQDGLFRLFTKCDVPFPASCPHPFSNLSGSSSMKEVSIAWLILTIVAFFKNSV